MLQISVGNDSKIFDLNEKKPREIWFLENCDRFGEDKESYIETGFNLVFRDKNDYENTI